MAQGGTIRFDVEVTGYWQRCPICEGCGTVPTDFYTRFGMATSTGRELCRRCEGSGTITTPIVADATSRSQAGEGS